MTIYYDGHAYERAADCPDLGSLVCDKAYNGEYQGKREYMGLSKDRDKLPKYRDLRTGSSCVMLDTGDVYFYESTTQEWYKQ